VNSLKLPFFAVKLVTTIFRQRVSVPRGKNKSGEIEIVAILALASFLCSLLLRPRLKMAADVAIFPVFVQNLQFLAELVIRRLQKRALFRLYYFL